jgi:hypothetical protein
MLIVMHFSSIVFSLLAITPTFVIAMPTSSHKAMDIRTRESANDLPDNLQPRANIDAKHDGSLFKEDADTGSDSDSTIKPSSGLQAKKEEPYQSMVPPPKKQSSANSNRKGMPVLPPGPALPPGRKESQTEMQWIDKDNWNGYGEAGSDDENV